MSGADIKFRDVVEITDFGQLQIVVFKRVEADVALRCVFILLPLVGTHAIHRSIPPKLFHDCRFSLDEQVYKRLVHFPRPTLPSADCNYRETNKEWPLRRTLCVFESTLYSLPGDQAAQ